MDGTGLEVSPPPPAGLERDEWVSWTSFWMSGPDGIWLGGTEPRRGAGKGAVLHSSDGGRAWTEELQGRLTDVEEVTATPDSLWVLSHTGPSFRRFGAGPWEPAPFPDGFRALRIVFPGDVHFGSKYVGYLLGRDAQSAIVLKSEDSGGVWRRLPLPDAAKHLSSISTSTRAAPPQPGSGETVHANNMEGPRREMARPAAQRRLCLQSGGALPREIPVS